MTTYIESFPPSCLLSTYMHSSKHQSYPHHPTRPNLTSLPLSSISRIQSAPFSNRPFHNRLARAPISVLGRSRRWRYAYIYGYSSRTLRIACMRTRFFCPLQFPSFLLASCLLRQTSQPRCALFDQVLRLAPGRAGLGSPLHHLCRYLDCWPVGK